MFINDPPKSQARKELKVNLPGHQHRALRSLQVLSGREAPVLVTEALSLYFSKLAQESPASGPSHAPMSGERRVRLFVE